MRLHYWIESGAGTVQTQAPLAKRETMNTGERCSNEMLFNLRCKNLVTYNFVLITEVKRMVLPISDDDCSMAPLSQGSQDSDANSDVDASR